MHPSLSPTSNPQSLLHSKETWGQEPWEQEPWEQEPWEQEPWEQTERLPILGHQMATPFPQSLAPFEGWGYEKDGGLVAQPFPGFPFLTAA